MNAGRQAFEEGVGRMEQALAAGRRIAWLSLAAFTAAVCAIVLASKQEWLALLRRYCETALRCSSTRIVGMRNKGSRGRSG
jgi:hypothetical protein